MYQPSFAMGVIAAAVKTADSSADPFFNKVVALCDFAGADGSTTFVDRSSVGRTLTPHSASISNAHGQFSSTSAYFPGASGLDIAYGTDLNLGVKDFTLEFSMYFGALVDETTVISHMTSAGGSSYLNVAFAFSVTPADAGNYDCRIFFGMVGNTAVALNWTTGTLREGRFNRIGIRRVGSTFELYADNVLVATTTSSGTIQTVTDPIRIGNSLNRYALDFIGWVDNLRLTVGVGRNLTVAPTTEWPTA